MQKFIEKSCSLLGRNFFAALALCFAAAPSRAAPANTIKEMFVQLGACLEKEGHWKVPGEITLRFSLRRDGSLIGKVHITYSKLPHNEVEKPRFVEEMAAAMDRCLPLKITDAFGNAFAGHMIAYRYVVKARETGI